MKHVDVRKYVLCALFVALICVATMLITIPAPIVGYIHIGDVFVILAPWALGPVFGAVAAGLGSALSDLLLGYTVYAPATFVIKAAVALIAYFLFKAFTKKQKGGLILRLISAMVAELFMILGYFAYEFILYDLPTASAGILLNGIQAAFGAIAGALVATLLAKYSLLDNLGLKLH